MKKIIPIIFATVFCGCSEPNEPVNKPVKPSRKIEVNWTLENGYEDSQTFTVIIVDSCEYLKSNYDRSRSITHKGNCRFCEQRRRNEN